MISQFETPLTLPTVQIEINYFEQSYKLGIELDKGDKIIGYEFACIQESEYYRLFHTMGEKILKNKFSECLLQIKYEEPLNNFINIPFIMLKNMMNAYFGGHKNLGQLKDLNESNLVCRCFGVNVAELKQQLDRNPNAKMLDIQKETLAGSGCGKCLLSVDEIITDFRKSRLH